MTVAEQLAAAKVAVARAEADLAHYQSIIDDEEARKVSQKLLSNLNAVAFGPRPGTLGEIRVCHDPVEVFVEAAMPPPEMIAERMNEVFARIGYAIDNPDTSLAFTDDGPRLVQTDIDHETLFKLGRKARS